MVPTVAENSVSLGNSAKKPLPGHWPVWASNRVVMVVPSDSRTRILSSDRATWVSTGRRSLRSPASVVPEIWIFALPGGFPRHRLEHAFIMIIAIVVAHLSIRWRNADDPARIFRNNLIVIVIALALIFIGVTMLRGGWIFA